MKDDQDLFDEILSSVAYQHFSCDVSNGAKYFRYTSMLTREGGSQLGIPTGELTRVDNEEDYRTLIQEGMKSYEREVKELGILLFDEVLENMAKIDRVLSSSQKNDLFLIGKAGVGRRSMLNLVASMQNMQIFSPLIGKSYSIKEWNRDLKYLFSFNKFQG